MFFKMRKSLSNRSTINTRSRMLRCYVVSTLYYEMETWTMKKAEVLRIQAFNMWCYRRILNISWMDKIRNEEVLRRMNKSLEVMNVVKTRKL